MNFLFFDDLTHGCHIVSQDLRVRFIGSGQFLFLGFFALKDRKQPCGFLLFLRNGFLFLDEGLFRSIVVCFRFFQFSVQRFKFCFLGNQHLLRVCRLPLFVA